MLKFAFHKPGPAATPETSGAETGAAVGGASVVVQRPRPAALQDQRPMALQAKDWNSVPGMMFAPGRFLPLPAELGLPPVAEPAWQDPLGAGAVRANATPVALGRVSHKVSDGPPQGRATAWSKVMPHTSVLLMQGPAPDDGLATARFGAALLGADVTDLYVVGSPARGIRDDGTEGQVQPGFDMNNHALRAMVLGGRFEPAPGTPTASAAAKDGAAPPVPPRPPRSAGTGAPPSPRSGHGPEGAARSVEVKTAPPRPPRPGRPAGLPQGQLAVTVTDSQHRAQRHQVTTHWLDTQRPGWVRDLTLSLMTRWHENGRLPLRPAVMCHDGASESGVVATALHAMQCLENMNRGQLQLSSPRDLGREMLTFIARNHADRSPSFADAAARHRIIDPLPLATEIWTEWCNIISTPDSAAVQTLRTLQASPGAGFASSDKSGATAPGSPMNTSVSTPMSTPMSAPFSAPGAAGQHALPGAALGAGGNAGGGVDASDDAGAGSTPGAGAGQVSATRASQVKTSTARHGVSQAAVRTPSPGGPPPVPARPFKPLAASTPTKPSALPPQVPALHRPTSTVSNDSGFMSPNSPVSPKWQVEELFKTARPGTCQQVLADSGVGQVMHHLLQEFGTLAVGGTPLAPGWFADRVAQWLEGPVSRLSLPELMRAGGSPDGRDGAPPPLEPGDVPMVLARMQEGVVPLLAQTLADGGTAALQRMDRLATLLDDHPDEKQLLQDRVIELQANWDAGGRGPEDVLLATLSLSLAKTMEKGVPKRLPQAQGQAPATMARKASEASDASEISKASKASEGRERSESGGTAQSPQRVVRYMPAARQRHAATRDTLAPLGEAAALPRWQSTGALARPDAPEAPARRPVGASQVSASVVSLPATLVAEQVPGNALARQSGQASASGSWASPVARALQRNAAASKATSTESLALLDRQPGLRAEWRRGGGHFEAFLPELDGLVKEMTAPAGLRGYVRSRLSKPSARALEPHLRWGEKVAEQVHRQLALSAPSEAGSPVAPPDGAQEEAVRRHALLETALTRSAIHRLLQARFDDLSPSAKQNWRARVSGRSSRFDGAFSASRADVASLEDRLDPAGAHHVRSGQAPGAPGAPGSPALVAFTQLKPEESRLRVDQAWGPHWILSLMREVAGVRP